MNKYRPRWWQSVTRQDSIPLCYKTTHGQPAIHAHNRVGHHRFSHLFPCGRESPWTTLPFKNTIAINEGRSEECHHCCSSVRSSRRAAKQQWVFFSSAEKPDSPRLYHLSNFPAQEQSQQCKTNCKVYFIKHLQWGQQNTLLIWKQSYISLY